MPGSEDQKKAFLAAPHYAVVGASKDETKFGTKVRVRLCAIPRASLTRPAGAEVVHGTRQGGHARAPRKHSVK